MYILSLTIAIGNVHAYHYTQHRSHGHLLHTAVHSVEIRHTLHMHINSVFPPGALDCLKEIGAEILRIFKILAKIPAGFFFQNGRPEFGISVGGGQVWCRDY